MIFLGCMFSHAIIAFNHQKNIIWFYILTSITSVIGYLIFIPKFSYYGAAWVTIYSETLIALLSAWYVYKHIKFIPKLSIFPKAIISSLFMALILYFIPTNIYNNYLGLLLVLIVAIITYTLALIIFKGISKAEILSLIGKKNE